MKNLRRSVFISLAGAVCLLFAVCRSFGDEPPPAAQPGPSGTPVSSPAPGETPPPIPPPSAISSPAVLQEPPPASPTSPMPPAQSPAAPAIPFNAQNKEVAKSIYLTMKQIQDTEFDPATNLAAIDKLQDAIAQTDFSGVPLVADYVKASLTLNTLRSRDIKIQKADTGKSDKEKESKGGTKIQVGMFSASAGIENEKSSTQKNEDDSTSDVSISSQNDPEVLDKSRQQQAIEYGLLLNELKRLGFSRPIDPQSIYGRWKWRCDADEATYEFDFRKDGTVYVKLDADKPGNWVGHGFLNKGRGKWKLDYRALSLQMNDVNLAGFWKQHSLIFFANKEIVSINDEKMVIASDEDNELKRIEQK